MSIDARVIGVTWKGTVAYLILEPRDEGGCAGQVRLTVHYPPLALPTLVGRDIWGGDNFLMCGDRRIGRRIGYTACELSNSALLDLPWRRQDTET
jgi:hypothetical protein